MTRVLSTLVTLMALLSFAAFAARVPAATPQPETVMVTFHPKSGADTEMARVIASHWKTANDLKMVNPAPHLTLRGADENNKTYFVEIFTWRDSAIPDHAPAAIQKIWAEMNSLVENQPGRPGLIFTEVSILK